MRHYRFILAIIVVAIMPLITSSCCDRKDETKAKYIFLLIGDGMGQSHVALAESYLSYKAGKLGGEQLTFSGFPNYGIVTNYSADHITTCSAAAGTAIATGTKTNNGMLGVDPEGNPHESVAERLKKDGYKVGIISSVPINDATPAAFYSHVKSRRMGYEISKSMASSGFEFFAGGGFKNHKSKDGEYIGDYLTSQGMTMCYSQEEFESADKSGRIVMCEPYNREKEPKTYYAGAQLPEGHITISQYLDNAIEMFGEEPFFIMCEGGEIDWAAHSNKTMPTINTILTFDKAVQRAYEFYLKHPDETLIIVTADHETGGVTLGYGSTHDYTIRWGVIDSAYNAAGQTNTLDAEQNRLLNESALIGWTTTDHTGGHIPIYAIGKGAERFSGRMDNTDIKGKILAE